MSSPEPAISLQDVSVTFKSGLPLLRHRTITEALKGVSFEAYHGETIGVIGPNGSGKSTLLQLLNGIILPDSGKIIFHDVSASLLSLTVGFDQNVSGRNNAILQGMLLGLDEMEIREQIDDIIEFSELEDFIDEPVKNYSTGMKARLGFSVATRVKTDVLLIDEVFAVGDEKFRKKSRQVMIEKMKSGDTVILVSHSTADMHQLCDRVIWLEGGGVEMIGTPAEVMPKYNASTD